MDSDMRAWRKRRLELIPEFRRLIPEIPIAMFVARREVALLGSRPFFVCAHTQNDACIAFLLDQLFEAIRFQGRAAIDASQRMVHSSCERFLVLPDDQLETPLTSDSIAIFDHGWNFVARIDVQEWKGDMA